MNITTHIKQYLDLYIIILTWVVAGAFAPSVVAIVWSAFTFLLILRTGNITKVLFGFLMMLIFSDSRMRMFDFAETAKIFVVVLLFAHVFINFKEYKQYDNRVFRYLMPFLIFSVLATTWSVDTVAAFQKSVSYTLVCFTVPLIFLRALSRNEELGIDIIMFFIIILGAGLVFYVLNPAAITITGRYHGLLGNPNGLGIFQVILFPLCYLFWKQMKDHYDFSKIVWVFIIVYCASLVLTGSRTALFAVLIFVVFSRLRYFSNWATIMGFLALVIGFEYMMSQLPQIIRYVGLEDYMRLETLHQGSGRDVAWIFAWQQIDEVFFAGGGFGYTEHIYQVNYEYLSRLGHQGNAHNSYLTLWLDTGLIGLVLFCIGIIRIVISSLKTSLYTLPIVFAILFSTYYESWLAASLNPFTSLFFILLTFLIQKQEVVGIEEDLMNKNSESERHVIADGHLAGA